MTRPDMTYDPDADAVYIRLTEEERPFEGEEVTPGVVLDLTEDGRVTGIEIMPASKLLAPGAWRDARLPGGKVEIAAE